LGDLTNKATTKYAALPGGANEMPFTISIKGNFDSISSFIHDFDNLRIATIIDTLGINSSKSDNGLTIVAVISGRVPYMGQK
jgi:Tfp pilus assembly protein PilO